MAPPGREWAGLGHAVFRSLELPAVIAAVGTAVGRGLEAVARDLRVLAENAKLGQPEIKLGMIPGWGAPAPPHLAGMTLAREMVLTGERWGPSRPSAPDWPTASSRPPTSSHRPHPRGRFSGASRLALGYAKQALVGARRASLESALALEVDLFVRAFATADRAEGLAAFLEKRPRPSRGNEWCPVPPLPRALSAS